MRDLIRYFLQEYIHEQRKPSGYWNFDSISQEAAKYDTSREFELGSPGAYDAAKKKGILPLVTSHMKKLTYWTKELVYAESLKYNHKRDFRKFSPKAYTAANKNGWYDEVTQHMIPLGNKYKRLIYAFEFSDNSVYVGLTGDEKRREKQHNENGPVSRHILQTGITPKFLILSDFLDVRDAQSFENCTIEKYKRDGWTTLNKHRGGGLGACQKVWKYEKIKDMLDSPEFNFKSRADFKLKMPGAYAAIMNNPELKDEFFRKIPIAKKDFWTKDEIIDLVKNYNSRSEFKSKSGGAYNVAKDLGILDDLFPEKKSRWDNNQEKESDIQESGGLLSKLIQRVSKPVVSNIDDIIKKFSYFETAQGSKYIRNEKGQLRRWKSKHANTGGEDMGLHAWSSQSIFVPQNFAHEANSLQHLIGKGFKTAIAKNKDGKLVILIADKGKWRPATWSDAYPNYVKSNPAKKDKTIMFEYSKEPKVGYSVVDFDLKPNTTEIKGYHFGSPVSKISGQIPKEEVKLFFPSKK